MSELKIFYYGQLWVFIEMILGFVQSRLSIIIERHFNIFFENFYACYLEFVYCSIHLNLLH